MRVAYQAKGFDSGDDFAVKVLHKTEMRGMPTSLEFCEIPLSELRFEEEMAGHEHINGVVESFEDAHCHYVVFELAEGEIVFE